TPVPPAAGRPSDRLSDQPRVGEFARFEPADLTRYRCHPPATPTASRSQRDATRPPGDSRLVMTPGGNSGPLLLRPPPRLPGHGDPTSPGLGQRASNEQATSKHRSTTTRQTIT